MSIDCELDALTSEEAKAFGYPVCPCGCKDVEFVKRNTRQKKITQSIKTTTSVSTYFCFDCGDTFDVEQQPSTLY